MVDISVLFEPVGYEFINRMIATPEFTDRVHRFKDAIESNFTRITAEYERLLTEPNLCWATQRGSNISVTPLLFEVKDLKDVMFEVEGDAFLREFDATTLSEAVKSITFDDWFYISFAEYIYDVRIEGLKSRVRTALEPLKERSTFFTQLAAICTTLCTNAQKTLTTFLRDDDITSGDRAWIERMAYDNTLASQMRFPITTFEERYKHTCVDPLSKRLLAAYVRIMNERETVVRARVICKGLYSDKRMARTLPAVLHNHVADVMSFIVPWVPKKGLEWLVAKPAQMVPQHRS